MRAIPEVTNERRSVIEEVVDRLVEELGNRKLTGRGRTIAMSLGSLLLEAISEKSESSIVFYDSIGKISSHRSDSNKNGSGILYWLIYGVLRTADGTREEQGSERDLLECALDYDLLPLLVWARDKRPLLRQLKRKARSNRKLRLRLKEEGSSTGELIDTLFEYRVFRLYSGTKFPVNIGERGDSLIKRLETLRANPQLTKDVVLELLRKKMITADAFDGKE